MNIDSHSMEYLKVVVIGGSGLIGRKLVNILRGQGHSVVAASRSTGIDVLTGEGLATGMAGAQVVVDVSNSPSFEDQQVLAFFETSTRNLLAAESVAGVRHHIALSVVGTERMQESGYFRAKLTQEELIRRSATPFTIARATQFFEFAAGIAQAATQNDVIKVSTALMQPIAAEDVAKALAALVLEAPVHGIVELAGPETIRQDEFVRQFLAATGDSRQVVADAKAGYFGTPVTDRSLTPDEGARLGSVRFSDWLANSASRG